MAGEIEPALYSLNRVVRLAPDSALALEAKRYLTRMRSVIENSPETTVPSGTSSEKLRRFDVMTRQDLLERNSSVPVAPKGTQSESKGKISIPSTAWLPTGPDTPQPDSESGQMKSVEAPGSGPQETIQGSPEPVGSEAQVPVADNQPMTFEPQWQYVVQIGSFVDKKAAESEKDKLKQRGYSVTVKSMKHQVLGQVYVVQLKPVSSAAKANTLMTQLETAEQTKPVLIKLPAN